ncbi:hypothetical protein HOD29_05000 [archaeon]|jgi:hypothetical protein|nr:hypothetical protein [archaeon]
MKKLVLLLIVVILGTTAFSQKNEIFVAGSKGETWIYSLTEDPIQKKLFIVHKRLFEDPVEITKKVGSFRVVNERGGEIVILPSKITLLHVYVEGSYDGLRESIKLDDNLIQVYMEEHIKSRFILFLFLPLVVFSIFGIFSFVRWLVKKSKKIK